MQSFKCYYPTKSEMLKTLTVDMRVDSVHFRDQFEWDMNNTMNSPEAFAELTAREIGMSFEPKVAHSFRESIAQL